MPSISDSYTGVADIARVKNQKMHIGLISDTHSYMDDRILEHFKLCDEIWHLGDVGNHDVLKELATRAPLFGVFGNIDGTTIRKQLPEHVLLERGGLKFLLIHIAGPLGKYTPQTRKLIEQTSPDVLLCGHSHILKVKRDERFNLLYLNPGAAGKHGFHKVRTICTLDIEDGKLKDLRVVELGPRST